MKGKLVQEKIDRDGEFFKKTNTWIVEVEATSHTS